jgi:hypothetical protein
MFSVMTLSRKALILSSFEIFQGQIPYFPLIKYCFFLGKSLRFGIWIEDFNGSVWN